MLQVDLSAVRGPELRRLLDAARQRGQAAEAYEILQEMAARRARGGRKSAEHHTIAINLGDPLERPDEEVRRVSEPDTAPPADADVEPPLPKAFRSIAPEPEPLRLEEPEFEPPEAEAPASFDLRIDRAPPPPEPQRRRFPGAGFAAGILVGAALGWWMSGLVRERLPSPVASVAAAQPTAPVVQPPPTPAAEPAAPTAAASPAPTPETAADSVAAPPAPDPHEAAAAPQSPAPADPAEAADAGALSPTGAPAGPRGCAAEPTPADQTICRDPKLQRLQRDLRQAYAEALDAHEDRALLREHQLAWRDERSPISDPDRLVRLYEERIRRLNAATADAREHR